MGPLEFWTHPVRIGETNQLLIDLAKHNQARTGAEQPLDLGDVFRGTKGTLKRSVTSIQPSATLRTALRVGLRDSGVSMGPKEEALLFFLSTFDSLCKSHFTTIPIVNSFVKAYGANILVPDVNVTCKNCEQWSNFTAEQEAQCLPLFPP